ncbi:hypothetical protein HED49_11815 [Ochrobactrum daejeonense]|nr:hypothetical protein [Brucella daejeonensis]
MAWLLAFAHAAGYFCCRAIRAASTEYKVYKGYICGRQAIAEAFPAKVRSGFASGNA